MPGTRVEGSCNIYFENHCGFGSAQASIKQGRCAAERIPSGDLDGNADLGMYHETSGASHSSMAEQGSKLSLKSRTYQADRSTVMCSALLIRPLWMTAISTRVFAPSKLKSNKDHDRH